MMSDFVKSVHTKYCKQLKPMRIMDSDETRLLLSCWSYEIYIFLSFSVIEILTEICIVFEVCKNLLILHFRYEHTAKHNA
jgi:hypothetical protein